MQVWMEGKRSYMKIFLWVVCFVALKITAVKSQGEFGRMAQGTERHRKFDVDLSMGLNRMSMEELTLLKFVLDFTVRSQWESVVLFVGNNSEYFSTFTPFIFHYFNTKGIFTSIHSTSKPLLPRSVFHNRHHLGIIYICDSPDEDFLRRVSDQDLFDFYRSWLIIMKPKRNNTCKLDELLENLNIGLGTNLILATINRRTPPTTVTRIPPITTTVTQRFFGYRKRHAETQICLNRSSRQIQQRDSNMIVQLVQIYKGSKSENETIKLGLGYWDLPNGLLKSLYPVAIENRWDLGGSRISVGLKNSSQEVPGGSLIPDQFSLDSVLDEEYNFLELFDCLMYGVNASFELNQFQKLGFRNEEGGWTNLLGAVVDGSVDFALETINVNVDKTQDMSFTYAIVITMNNIYFRKAESGGLRDIFLAPFSPRLLLCVLFTSILLAIAMVTINFVSYQMVESKKSKTHFKIFTKRNSERSVVVTSKEARKWEISDAALWSLSVLCMQGSQWSPNSVSGSLLLINGLLFALIIYNSFAAFITSVLSVKDVKIKNLKDLAGSDFAFGYTLGNADELFLRTVNNTLLRELYFKGLKENDGVTDPILGMHRTSKGKYAFFVSARTARRALRTVVAHSTRCDFQELNLPVTKNYASIPVTKNSPLRKILNYKIIRLIETGILHRFQRLILPTMPRCVEKTTFNSARLTDVYSAFFVLAVGWIASLIIFVGELIWHKRKKMGRSLISDKWEEEIKYGSFKSTDGLFWLK